MRGHLLLVLSLVLLPFAGVERAASVPFREAEVQKVAVGKNIYLEIEDKRPVRVVVEAKVCLRDGMLEHLLTRRARKEHESILVADIAPRVLDAALRLAGATSGQPVVFYPREIPPTGTAIRISLAYRDELGTMQQIPAQRWIRHHETRKDLHTDWVFAGSRLIPHFEQPNESYFLADDGDVICVSNFEAALLDLPFLSSNHDNEFEAHTERIPPLDTPVLVILEPLRR